MSPGYLQNTDMKEKHNYLEMFPACIMGMGTELVNQSDQRKAVTLPDCPDSPTNYHLNLSGLSKSFIMKFFSARKKKILRAKYFAKFVSFEIFKALFCSLSGILTQFHDSFFKDSLIQLPIRIPRSEGSYCSL